MEYLIEDDSVFKQSGIYQIRNKITNQVYIGSARDLSRRYYLHNYHLEKNEHHNPYLQRSYNKYGSSNFTFSILEIVEIVDILLEREQYYLDNMVNLFNISLNATAIFAGRNHTEESKQKTSETLKETIAEIYEHDREKYDRIWGSQEGENNGMYGKTHSEETRRKIGEKSKGRIQPTKKCMIDGVIYNSGQHAARVLGLCRETVNWRLRNKNFKTYIRLKDIQD